jgi:hypothetical protein
MASGLANSIAALAIIVLIFLVCRVIVLWYWRVGEAINLLKSIDEKLGRLSGTVTPQARERGAK